MINIHVVFVGKYVSIYIFISVHLNLSSKILQIVKIYNKLSFPILTKLQ